MTDSAMRRARFLVLESLYEAENSDHNPEEVFARQMERVAEEDAEVTGPGPSGFGRGAIRGVWRRRAELDSHIEAAAGRYPVDTMAVVDRNILRLAIWELLTDEAAPAGAVVNEAVELARRYGGESSPPFVNGVLRTVSERIRANREPSRDAKKASAPTS